MTVIKTRIDNNTLSAGLKVSLGSERRVYNSNTNSEFTSVSLVTGSNTAQEGEPSKGLEAFPLDYEEMEFKAECEDWNEYELKTGVRIKARISLAKILRNSNAPNNLRADISAPHWAVYAPALLRGIPSTDILADPAQLESKSKYKVPVEKNHEPWNVYTILRTGQELKLKLIVEDVYQFVGVYDHEGCPVYDAPHGATVLVKDSMPDQGS